MLRRMMHILGYVREDEVSQARAAGEQHEGARAAGQHHKAEYSVSGNGVAYRKASDYLKDKEVMSFLKEAERIRPTR